MIPPPFVPFILSYEFRVSLPSRESLFFPRPLQCFPYPASFVYLLIFSSRCIGSQPASHVTVIDTLLNA